MKSIKLIILFSIYLLINSCITQFIPETDEYQELLVVEGLITDQYGINSIKLSKSLPLWEKRNTVKPLKGCTVKITDDQGHTYMVPETKTSGTYQTNPATFKGVVGRKYTLHVSSNNALPTHYSYESLPMEMKPVPPIDSVYYEKKTIKESYDGISSDEGCQIYLNTHDPANQSKFYRWEYSETWKFKLPYDVTNNVCWISNNSNVINIKSTLDLTQDRIYRYPLTFISNKTDRLNEKYSILVNQYSLNEDEYVYWEKRQKITENVGSLYDITPAALPSNIYCIENPNETVLGYFSVSAISSKRIFIKDHFSGLIDRYIDCNHDTIFQGERNTYPAGSWWVIIDYIDPLYPRLSYKVITLDKGCADCTVRGTNTAPDFWIEGK